MMRKVLTSTCAGVQLTDYDELSEYAPNEHEVLETVDDYNELLNTQMYDD